MNKKSLLKTLGICYNSNDFSEMKNLLDSDAEYEAYDCIYKVVSSDNVIRVLEESVKNGTSAYAGFYLFKGILIKRLTECILICNNEDLKCIRIVHLKIKRGKIVNIVGFDPDEYEFTRGKKIDY